MFKLITKFLQYSALTIVLAFLITAPTSFSGDQQVEEELEVAGSVPSYDALLQALLNSNPDTANEYLYEFQGMTQTEFNALAFASSGVETFDDSDVFSFYERNGRYWHCAEKRTDLVTQFIRDIIKRMGRGTPLRPIIEAIDSFSKDEWNEITNKYFLEVVKLIAVPASCYETCGEERKVIPGCFHVDDLNDRLDAHRENLCFVNRLHWDIIMAEVKAREIKYEADRNGNCVNNPWGFNGKHEGLDPLFDEHHDTDCSIADFLYSNLFTCDDKMHASDLDEEGMLNDPDCFLPEDRFYNEKVSDLLILAGYLKGEHGGSQEQKQCPQYTSDVVAVERDLNGWSD